MRTARAQVWAVFVGLLCASSPGGAADREPQLYAALHVFGYGYKVRVLVNGGDTGIRGGLSEGRRLFARGDRAAVRGGGDILARHFVLRRGANEITIKYSKLDSATDYPLEIILDADRYPQPVFRFINRRKTSDTVTTTITIETTPAPSFKPVVVEDPS